MKKIFYFITIIISFVSFSLCVGAARGDLIYNVESVNINDKGINIQGYAFIHRTQNYVTIYKRFEDVTNNVSTSEIVASGGGQTTIIVASKCDYANDSNCSSNSNNFIKKTYSDDPYEAEYNGRPVAKNYNFYYQQFNSGDPYGFYVDRYNEYEKQSCTLGGKGQCYYEDVGFNITFSVDELIAKFSSEEKLYFYIAAYNNDYGKDTIYKPLAISGISGNSDYVDISETTIKGLVNFVAGEAGWQKPTGGKYASKFFGCTRPREDDSNFGQWSWCNKGNDFDTRVKNSEYYMMKADYGDLLIPPNINTWAYNTNFLIGTGAPGMYCFCVNTKTRRDACSNLENGFCTDCSGQDAKVLCAFSSWVEIHGDNQFIIKVKNPHLCEVTDPDKNSGTLECNGNKTYNSTCEELTLTTSEGSARVKIEQTGNVSSVLTPDSIYAGGGFNFGIMYYNTIKWSYVPGQNIDSDLHTAVTESMNNKIKDYDAYIAGINISNLKMGGKVFNLVKQCTTSNNSKDYYNKELTVSCIFTIPSSDIDQVGNVDYRYDVNGFNINNKYYTPINYEGDYKITADIVGMDRITKNAAESDSKEQGKAWTGNWSDSFTNCEIDVYGLLMKNNVYNFIYRPIDIFKPFPNRNPGINWFDWMNVPSNVERLKNTYSDIDYTVNLDNKAIADIKNYNSGHNYLEWDSIDEITKESSFITEKDYIVRGGN